MLIRIQSLGNISVRWKYVDKNTELGKHFSMRIDLGNILIIIIIIIIIKRLFVFKLKQTHTIV